jgi:hypothetical protein
LSHIFFLSGSAYEGGSELAGEGLKRSAEELVKPLIKVSEVLPWDAPLNIAAIDKAFRAHNENYVKWQELRMRRYTLMRELGLPGGWVGVPGGAGYSRGPDGRLYQHGVPIVNVQGK